MTNRKFSKFGSSLHHNEPYTKGDKRQFTILSSILKFFADDVLTAIANKQAARDR